MGHPIVIGKFFIELKLLTAVCCAGRQSVQPLSLAVALATTKSPETVAKNVPGDCSGRVQHSHFVLCTPRGFVKLQPGKALGFSSGRINSNNWVLPAICIALREAPADQISRVRLKERARQWIERSPSVERDGGPSPSPA